MTPAGPGPAPGTGASPAPGAPAIPRPDLEAIRARGLRRCLAAAVRRAKRHRSGARRNCVRRYGRTPGRVTGLRAQALSSSRVTLTFAAPGSDGHKAPAARAYVVKQSRRPIRTARDFRRAHALCRGSCGFAAIKVGAKIHLTVTRLRPHSTYYYAVAARDNVATTRLGPRSVAAHVRTR